MTETRICKVCGLPKPLDRYQISARGYVYRTCKDCQNKKAVEIYYAKKQLPKEELTYASPVLPILHPGDPCPKCGKPVDIDPDRQSLFCWCGYHWYPPVPDEDPEEQKRICRGLANEGGKDKVVKRVCVKCGSPFEGTATKKTCLKCDRDRNKANSRKANLRNRAA